MTTSGTDVNGQAGYIEADDIGQIRSVDSSFTSANKNWQSLLQYHLYC